MAKGFLDFKMKDSTPRIEDLVELHRFGPAFEEVRLAGDVREIVTHWITIYGKKTGKEVDIPRVAFDGDPWSRPEFTNEKRTRTEYYCNAFVLDKSETKPVVVRFPQGVARKIRELIPLNDGNEFSHPEKGCTILIRFDKGSPSPGQMYGIQKGSSHKLTKRQRKAKLWDLSKLGVPMKKSDAEKDAAELVKLAEPDDDPNDGIGDAYVNDEVAALRAEDKRGKRRKGKGRREHQEKPPTNKRPKGKRHPKRAKSAGKKGRGRGGKSK